MTIEAKRRARALVSLLPAAARTIFRHPSYAQEGEDRILLRHFGDRRDGFYVDVGAHHPYRFSNTCLLARRGWRGINIDALPGSMAAFRRARPRDVNLEIGIGREHGAATFHSFDEPALNTFDPALAAEHRAGRWTLRATIEVPILPLAEVLDTHRPRGVAIDLLTVDVEGCDLEVLESNDWMRHRPELVLAEAVGRSIDDLADEPAAVFLKAQGYRAIAKTVNTVFYADAESA